MLTEDSRQEVSAVSSEGNHEEGELHRCTCRSDRRRTWVSAIMPTRRHPTTRTRRLCMVSGALEGRSCGQSPLHNQNPLDIELTEALYSIVEGTLDLTGGKDTWNTSGLYSMTLRIRDSIEHKQNKCAPSLVRSIPSAVQAEYTVSIFHLTNGIYTTYLHFLPDILYPYCWPLRRLRAHLAFLPRVADTNCEPCAVLIEFDRRNRRVVFRVLSQPLLGLVVPDRHRSVRARRCKGTITESQRSLVSFSLTGEESAAAGNGCLHRVERKRIDRPYVVDIINGLSVALERVLLILGLGIGIEVLHSDTSFYRTGRVSCRPLVINSILPTMNGLYGLNVPCASGMHASARVMNFRLLSRVCAGASILRRSYM